MPCAGRLIHHLAEVDGLSLKSVEVCIMDEADRMFEMGFKEQVLQLIQRMSDRRQTLMFSATMPATLADFAQVWMGKSIPRLGSGGRCGARLRGCWGGVAVQALSS